MSQIHVECMGHLSNVENSKSSSVINGALGSKCNHTQRNARERHNTSDSCLLTTRQLSRDDSLSQCSLFEVYCKCNLCNGIGTAAMMATIVAQSLFKVSTNQHWQQQPNLSYHQLILLLFFIYYVRQIHKFQLNKSSLSNLSKLMMTIVSRLSTIHMTIRLSPIYQI